MGRLIDRLAIGAALVGGAVLLALMVLICVSVTGRGVSQLVAWAGPVKGDFELVEVAMPFVIFAFLPLCQLRGGHPTVNIVSDRLGLRATRWLAVWWELAFALALAVITWRLAVSTLEKACIPQRFTGDWCSVETTFRLRFPMWWSYAACVAASALATVTALWCAAHRAALGTLPARPDLHGGL